MKKLLPAVVFFCALLALIAHPHFSKSVVAKTQTGEVKVTFTTYPYGEEHLANVTDGFVFHCGRALLNTTAVLGGGGQTIPAGEYLVRAQAKSIDDWTLILVPSAGVENTGTADVSSGIRLSSTTLTGVTPSHHLDVDLYSGHGDTDGKLILAVGFGERRVEGVLELQ